MEEIDLYKMADRANAHWEEAEKDIERYVERRRRIVSDSWFEHGDKRLTVLVNRDRCFVMYLNDEDTQKSWFATDPITSEPDVEIWFELDNGQLDMQKRINTVPASIAFNIVQHFIETGDKDPGVVWDS